MASTPAAPEPVRGPPSLSVHVQLTKIGAPTARIAPEMSDLHDHDYAERLASEAPDAYLSRRDFLQRTALAAGLTTALGTVLAPDVLVAEAARKQRRKSLPAPKNLPIDTFVVLMMENRSF